MNRRSFAAVGMARMLIPTPLFAQTPMVTPAEPPADTTARTVSDAMRAISPLALLEALETHEVTNTQLAGEAAGGTPTAIPWTDMSDTDLYNSLGGVIVTLGGTDLHDEATVMLGGYIVYESAEIAYHQLVRQLGDTYDNPGNTMAVGGTNAWIRQSDEFSIAIYRIGYVIGLAMQGPTSGNSTLGLIQHLAEVTDSTLV